MKKDNKKLRAESIVLVTMMMLMGAGVAVTAESAGYTLTVQTNATQYYPAEKVLTSGTLTKDGTGVPEARIMLTYIDPNQGVHPGPSLGVLTDKQGNYEYTFELPEGAVLGEWTVKAKCENPIAEASAVFTVVSKTIVVDAGGPYAGTIGELIQFSGSATGGKTPYSWSWKFGDGGVSDQQNPTHAYTDAGTFTAELTVTDSEGIEGSDTATVIIADEGEALLDVSIKAGIGLTIVITNGGDVDAVNVKWNLSIEKGFIFKPKTRIIEGSLDSLGVGEDYTFRTIMIGVGKIKIAGNISADNAPTVPIAVDCLLIGVFIFFR